MTKEKLRFKNSKGDTLVGILSNPTDSVGTPVAVLCHGFMTSKNNSTNTALEKLLNDAGIATFRFDFFAHGESEGAFEEITVSEGVDDTVRAIDFLKSLGYKTFGLHGGSYGGSTSLMTASKTNDLSVLTLKAPVVNYADKEMEKGVNSEMEAWKERGYKIRTNRAGQEFRINYTFVEDFDNNNGYEIVGQITVPTLIVHGDKDQSVPVEQSIKFDSLLSDSRLEIIEGASHFFEKPEEFEKMTNYIADFLIEHLK